MTERLLDYDPLARAWNTVEFDGDKVIFRRYWESDDVNAILDANAQRRLENPKPSSEFRQVARIPDIVLYKWLTELGVDANDKNHQKKVNELLNSNEFYKLRTGGGRL